MLIYSGSDRGLVRSNNEDYHRYDRERQLMLVADGVGGQPYGEVASRIAVESAYQFLSKNISDTSDCKTTLSESFHFSHSQIVNQQKIKNTYKFMGTTLVAACLKANELFYAWAGDSRIYLLKSSEDSLILLSHDHTLLQEMEDVESENSVEQGYENTGNILTSMVGGEREFTVSDGSHTVNSGDLILLCTDGLSDLLSKDEIKAIIKEKNDDLSLLSQALIDKTYDKGAKDNITTVIGRVP